MKVAIIGGGLAGTACAYMLKKAGLEAEIYEAGASVASGASGNEVGLYNPRLAAEWTAESQFYAFAFNLALEIFAQLPDVGWKDYGALHLMTDETRAKRFRQMAQSWQGVEMRAVGTAEASQIAGVEIKHDALYLPRSGQVSPRKLCEAYAQDVKVNLGARISALPEAEAVIIASGLGAREFIDFPLQGVRGQITSVKAKAVSQNLNLAVCYGGYVTPAVQDVHTVGTTFQRWLTHIDILPEDDADNIAKLQAAVPSLQGDYEVTGHRAAIRTTTKDHFPVVGHVKDNIYVSTGHGSHGILSSLAGAKVISEMISGRAVSLSDDVLKKLSPARFAPGSI